VYVFTPFGEKDDAWRIARDHFMGKKFFLTGSLEDIPDPESFPSNDGLQRLFVFDDVQSLPRKSQQLIEKYFTTARHVDASCFYLCQSYHSSPKVVRDNCNYIFIMKDSADRRDLRQIAS